MDDLGCLPKSLWDYLALFGCLLSIHSHVSLRSYSTPCYSSPARHSQHKRLSPPQGGGWVEAPGELPWWVETGAALAALTPETCVVSTQSTATVNEF